MEAPSTLNGYFAVVDDFFNKTFRDNSALFLAIKTKQTTHVAAASNVDDAAPASLASAIPSHVSFSPRLFLNRDGTALGKIKISGSSDFRNGCHLKQGLAVNTQGTVSGFCRLRGIAEGLLMSVNVSANTILPASQDVTTLKMHYTRPDLYTQVEYQRNGLGSSNLVVDCGAAFLNLLVGGGFERQQISYLEQTDDTKAQSDVMYAGAGFTGVQWSLAGKVSRTDTWSMARLAAIQRLTPSSAVACVYNLDIREGLAETAIGFTQGLRLRLPNLLAQRHTATATNAAADAPMTYTTFPFVLACKGTSNGWCSATVRGVFSDTLRWGLVAHANLITREPYQYGIVLSLESSD